MAEGSGGRRLAARLRRREATRPDLRDRAAELTGHVVDDLFARIPAFALAGQEFREVVDFVVGRIVDVIVDTFREGRLATRTEVRELVDMTVPGAELGITLEDMLEVFHVALEVMWLELQRLAEENEVREPDLALDLSQQGVHLITELSRGVTKAYLEGDRIWLQREDAEQALVEGVLADPPRIEPALRAARALDLPVFEQWRCATYLPADGVGLETLRTQVARARRTAGLRGAVALIGDCVVLAIAAEGEPPELPATACMGVSRWGQGTVGIRQGQNEARQAADAAQRRGLPRLDHGQALLDRVFTGSISTAELADEVLAPLLALPGEKSRALLETLEAWLDGALSPTEAGRTLNLHPQSVRYRLGQLREHLGDDALDDPEARLRLHLAVKSRRLA